MVNGSICMQRVPIVSRLLHFILLIFIPAHSLLCNVVFLAC